MEEKIKIIDEIVKKHPSYGVDKGWSCYTGGMKDSGYWYFRKMLDEPLEVLKGFLDNIVKEENRPKTDKEILFSDAAKKFFKDIERKLLFGE